MLLPILTFTTKRNALWAKNKILKTIDNNIKNNYRQFETILGNEGIANHLLKASGLQIPKNKSRGTNPEERVAIFFFTFICFFGGIERPEKTIGI